MTLVPLVVEKNLRTSAGAMYSVFYYDEDGDGRFEASYGGLPPPKVPDWAVAAQNQPGQDR